MRRNLACFMICRSRIIPDISQGSRLPVTTLAACIHGLSNPSQHGFQIG